MPLLRVGMCCQFIVANFRNACEIVGQKVPNAKPKGGSSLPEEKGGGKKTLN